MKPFPWRAGMRAIDRRGNPWRVYADGFSGLRGQGEPAGYTADWLSVAELLGAMPDPNDGATRGAFLDAIREAWRLPTAHVVWSADKARVHDPDRPWRSGDDNDPALIELLNQYTWMVKGPGQTDAWLADIENRVSSEVYARVLRDILGNGPSEFAALMAAWEAAP